MTDQLRCSAGSARVPTRSDIGVLIRDAMGKEEGWLQYLPAADAILNYWAILNKNVARTFPAAQPTKVTDDMIAAAIDAAWPGPEAVYDDNFGSCEAMMQAALEAALVSQPSPAATVEKIGRVDREGGWNAGRDPAATVPACETVARILAHKMPSLRMANDTPGNYAHSIADEIVAALTNEPQGAGK